MDERQDILNKFVKQAGNILGEHLVRIILYGSYARGDHHERSDIDLMFLTTSSGEEIREEEKRLYDLAFDFEMEYGVDISVIVNNITHYQYWLGALPFYDNVEREGVVLNG